MASEGRPARPISPRSMQIKSRRVFRLAVFWRDDRAFRALAAGISCATSRSSRAVPAFKPLLRRTVWAALFNKDQQTYFVCADSHWSVSGNRGLGEPGAVRQPDYPPARRRVSRSGISSQILPQASIRAWRLRLVQGFCNSTRSTDHSTVRHALPSSSSISRRATLSCSAAGAPTWVDCLSSR